MNLLEVVRAVRRHLEESGRLSLRMLRRQYELDDEALAEVIEELVDVQGIAKHEGNVLVWAGSEAPSPQASTSSSARKVITVVFADLVGSTALHERIDPESARQLMESYYATLRAAIERHGGTVVKLLGDGVLAAFGVPQVAEDDAIRAVHAGVAMQEALGALVARQPTVLGTVGLRVAINTGEVVVSGANDDVVAFVTDRWIIEGGWRTVRTVLATAGERLVLQHVKWTRGEPGADSELEGLVIDEVDQDGRFVRAVVLDVADRAAAHAELFERYVALGAVPQAAIEFVRGWNAHDLVRVRRGISDDFVLDDHRHTGMGRLEGADKYIESVAALYELIPDARADGLYGVAVERHGRVFVSRTWGHNREGGEVESLLVLLIHHPGEKLSRIEFFEIQHLDAALARFEELRSW